MIRRIVPLTVALVLLSACATTTPNGPPAPPPPPPPPTGPVLLDWRAVIRPAELGRLDRLRDAWAESLAEARSSARAADLAALGALADPDAGVAGVTPPTGEYRCRTIKLGAKNPGMPTYTAYAWFHCRIERTPKGLKLEKTTGSQRPSGLLFPDTNRRMVLLGSEALGDEPAANSYGVKTDRDFVGVLERLPGNRWRVAFPWPYLESDLDLMELVPAS